jgi:hypothetical protein
MARSSCEYGMVGPIYSVACRHMMAPGRAFE